MRRWPLFLIASPAAVAVWSGWVGLGGMCGFGIIHPLPGIVPGFELNTAITLPIGVEAYATFALSAWLRPGQVPPAARTFARRSAIGALILGCGGQVAYHLLAAAHAIAAPWPVVMVVACLPVVTVGLAAALAHLLMHSAAATVPEGVPGPAAANGAAYPEAAARFAAELEGGQVPGIRRIRSELAVGQAKAQRIQAHLRELVAAR